MKKNYILVVFILFIFTLFLSFFFRSDLLLNEKQSEIMKLYYSLPDYDNKLVYYEINWKPRIIFAHFTYKTKRNSFSEIAKYCSFLKDNGWEGERYILKKENRTVEFIEVNESIYTYYIYMEEL